MTSPNIKPQVREWLRAHTNFSPYTIQSYRYCLDALDAWLQRTDADLAKLTPADFHEFLDYQSNWAQNSGRLAGYAARSFVRWRYGNAHPLLKLKLGRPKRKPRRTLSAAQSARLLDRLDTDSRRDRRDRAIIAVMLDTGLRAFEVCGLLLEYLDLDIRVSWALVKGGEWRRVVFSKRTADILRLWLGERENYLDARQARGFDSDPRGRIFIGLGGRKPGSPITSHGLRHIFRSICARADIDDMNPHSARRGFAVQMSENGAPTRLVQLGGGWSSLSVLEGYLQNMQLTPEMLDPYFPVGRAATRGASKG